MPNKHFNSNQYQLTFKFDKFRLENMLKLHSMEQFINSEADRYSNGYKWLAFDTEKISKYKFSTNVEMSEMITRGK